MVDESYWMLDNEELNINLQKMKKGLTWTAVFIGHDEVHANITLRAICKHVDL